MKITRQQWTPNVKTGTNSKVTNSIKRKSINTGNNNTAQAKFSTNFKGIFTKNNEPVLHPYDYAMIGKWEGLERALANGADINEKPNTYEGDTALIEASERGYVEIVRNLLQYPDIDVNMQNNFGSTALHRACSNRNKDVVRELLRHPDIDLYIKDEDGRVAGEWCGSEITDMLKNYKRGVDRRINVLSSAIYMKTKEQVSDMFLSLLKDKYYEDAEIMLQKTPMIDLKGNNQKILTEVCGTKNPDFVRKVFEYEKAQPEMIKEFEAKRKEFIENINNATYEELKTNPIAYNTLEGFKIIMNKPEFDPNDKAGLTTLFNRAYILDPEGNLVKEILSKYPVNNLEKVKKSANSTIRYAVNEYEALGKYKFIIDDIKRKLINPQTRKVGIDKLDIFISSSEYRPEMTDTMGNTALHIVSTIADDSSRKLIERLLRKGVDINAKNVTNQNPIMSAIRALMAAEDVDTKEKLLSNIKFLLDKGSDIENQDKNGQTVFHYVCATTSVALLTMILKKNPNVFIADLKGNRPHIYLKTPEMKEIYREYINR